MTEAGIMLSEVPFSNLPLIFKKGGMDFFILDCEHGGFDYADISKILLTSRLAGLKCIVRLADNTRKDIVKFMDMGADGLLLPMTNRAADIKKAVEYAKYAPQGKRGLSTMRAHTLYAPPKILDYMKEANAATEIYAQIETAEGVKNVGEILSVEGVSGVLIGPNDLSCDFGCLADNDAPQILFSIEKTASEAKRQGKRSGIITTNEKYLTKSKACGMTMFCVGSELHLLKSGAVSTVKRIKEL